MASPSPKSNPPTKIPHLTDDDEDGGEAAGLLGGGGLAADGGEAVSLHPVVDQNIEGGEKHKGDDAGEQEPEM